MNTRTFLLAAVVVAVLAACNEVPVRNLTTTYQVQIQELRDRGKPAKLDILWVVDDSSSMCQEQQSLASSFAAFLEVFQRYTSIDMQLAVTSTNVCPVDPKKPGVAIRGKFMYKPATTFPIACMENRQITCLTDDDCRNNPTLPDAQNWVCDGKPAADLYTCDRPASSGEDPYPGDVLRSTNSTCRYLCDRAADPAQCARVFGAPEGCGDAGGGASAPMCEAGSCDTDKCLANATLDASVDCGLLCRGQDCADVCVGFLGDSAACASRCQAASGSCFDVCESVSKTGPCSDVCASDWGCVERCEAYLYDPAKCASACAAGTGAACRSACGTSFPNQDFLCFLACDSGYDCTDRCIAEFGASTYRCVMPSGSPNNSGCLRPPPTRFCPANGPTILNLGIADQWLKDWIAGDWAGHPDWDPAWKNLPLGDTDAEYDAREVARTAVFEQLFICMATIGAEQEPCGLQEQGLRAAWMALDPEGENADQAKRFLRDDAYLLVVVVSDEEDCSAPDLCDRRDPFTGQLLTNVQCIPAETYNSKCSCLRDENGCLPGQDPSKGECDPSKCLINGRFVRGNCPLYSTDSTVNRLRSLKPDPAQVVFAAISGDVQVDAQGNADTSTGLYRVDDPAAIAARYFECKCDGYEQRSPHTYICSSSNGKADPGFRYKRVAQSFGLGRFGQFANICSDEGIGPSLEQIANLVIPILTKVCLPRPMEWSCADKCVDTFNDTAKCEAACAAEDCFAACQETFPGEPGCADICAAGEFVEVYKYDAAGNCQKTDAAGNCLPLRQGTSASDPDAEFFLVKAAPDCVLFDLGLGERAENAIQFTTPLEYSDRLEIVYRTKPFYCQDRCARIFEDNPEFCNDLCGTTPEGCLESCVKAPNAARCAYVCTTSTTECTQQCESLNAEGATLNCNKACRDE